MFPLHCGCTHRCEGWTLSDISHCFFGMSTLLIQTSHFYSTCVSSAWSDCVCFAGQWRTPCCVHWPLNSGRHSKPASTRYVLRVTLSCSPAGTRACMTSFLFIPTNGHKCELKPDRSHRRTQTQLQLQWAQVTGVHLGDPSTKTTQADSWKCLTKTS